MGGSNEQARKRVLLITAGELTHDPRARRAAEVAEVAGLDVQGLCVSDGPGLPGLAVARVPTMRLEQRLRAAGVASVGRSSRAVREARGLYRLWRHAMLTSRLARAGRALGRFDVVHANDFDTLPAAAYLARRSNGRIVYDSHEIYTEQEPNAPVAYRAIVRRIEGALARRSHAVITVSPAYADRIKPLLALKDTPSIVMNCPPIESARVPRPTPNGRLRAIYQSSVGPGRFHEDLLLAADHADGASITIRMTGIDIDALRGEVASLGLGDRVEIVEPVPADRLVEGLDGFDVGLIINRPVTLNDELVLPNKLFEYMMAGLAVVAPDLPQLAEVIEREQAGVTFPAGDPQAMGRAIRRLAEDRPLLERLRGNARRAALDTYNAEAQAVGLARAWGLAPPTIEP
jgi:glycosyltransferase involved in cell wall biosynthesis